VDIRETKKEKQNYIPLIIVFQISDFSCFYKTVTQQDFILGKMLKS